MPDALKEIADKFSKDEGTRKPAHYYRIYETIFSAFRYKKINILELGVSTGASLQIWRTYFPLANIVGVDVIEPAEVLIPFLRSGSMHYVKGDQSNTTSLEQCLSKSLSGSFDIVIDDASHIGLLSKASFDFLFPRLKSGALYFVEDYGTGYMLEFFDGSPIEPFSTSNPKEFPSHVSGMVGWLKQLIDVMHFPYTSPGNPGTLPIDSIQFWPSLALVRRA